MEPTPITRASLHMLKREHDTAARQQAVAVATRTIYNRVIEAAKTGSKTHYVYEVSAYLQPSIADIVYGLTDLFPDSPVTVKFLARGIDGHMYDVQAEYDSYGIRLQGSNFQKAYITVDWSWTI
jgi:hypothetical protein